jgi:hypothetical protein
LGREILSNVAREYPELQDDVIGVLTVARVA